MARKKGVNINMRKLGVCQRHADIRRRGISPMKEAYEMLREVDPSFEKTIERQEKYYKP